jgi:hypothetical protein
MDSQGVALGVARLGNRAVVLGAAQLDSRGVALEADSRTADPPADIG